jgi:hypothetical protein
MANSNSNDEETVSVAEAEEQFKAAKAEREKAVAAVQQSEAEAKRQLDEYRETNASQEFLSQMGRTGISWNVSPDELRQLIGLVCVLRSSEDGKQLQALDKETGQDIGVRKALELLATKHHHTLVKGNTASHLLPQRADDGTYRPLSREDLKTWGQRSAFIFEHGLTAYENLGAKSTRGITTDIDRMTAHDVARMSLKQRAELVGRVGAEIYSMILSKKGKR